MRYRWALPAACACIAAATANAQSDAAAARLAFVGPSSATVAARLPGDAELEWLGATIGRVDVQVDDVFETGQHLAAPYRFANALHISTQTATVTEQLLFHSGEAYRRRTLDETARMLRGQRYLNEATVEPVRYNDDNTVDVVVRVHDVWTMSPGFSFGRKGGANSTHVEFEDTNFLGWGKQISVERASNVDRSSWRLAYVDPNVFGSWWKLSAAHADSSDGGENALSFGRPFYSLDSRWSFNAAGLDTTANQSMYALGHVVERFAMRHQAFEFGGGISRGLQDGWATRYLGGVRYEKNEFAALPGDPVARLPDDRAFAYPWVGVEIVEDQYLATRNLDQIGRTEDLYLGNKARFEIGFAASSFGSSQNAVMLRSGLQTGKQLGAEQYVLGTLDLAGRVEQGELRNTQLDLGTRYYLRHSPRSVLFASATLSLAAQLDPEQQLLLGGDNGLRGYPLRYQAGTQRALVTLEERFYTDWQPLKLFNVGAAVFFDAGRTWGNDPIAGEPLGWLQDVGVGLRLGSARSGLGNVLHIDLACPLDGGKDIDSVQLLIETKRSF